MGVNGQFRIGEFSRRVGVSPELLRAWEARYGLLAPERTSGGLRLYSKEDERRVRQMQRQLAAGLSAAEAARVVLPGPAAVPAELLIDRLDRALSALDEVDAQAALDSTFESLGLEAALTQVILPFLHDLGRRWAANERSVGQEHFASNVIDGRLRTLARGWGEGRGPYALLACPPGEQHELGLLSFGLLLRQRGWRIAYLGAQTPTPDLERAAEELSPTVVVLVATRSQPFIDAAEGIRQVCARTRVAIGGAGATEGIARSLGAEHLGDDLLAAVRAVSPTGNGRVPV